MASVEIAGMCSPTTPAAYGLRLDGIAPSPALALRGAEDWPVVRIRRELTEARLPRESRIGDERATIVNPAAVLSVDRRSAEVTVRSRAPVADAELFHPSLWPVGAVFARWNRAETLHAGAFADPGSGEAWAVMAESGGGKTSFLAGLALAGVEVLVDDLLVVQDGECFAGPRCLDLRPDAVELLDLGARTTMPVRSTSRERLMLDPCDGRWAVRGFIELAWGPATRLERLAPAESLASIARHRRVLGLGAEFEQLLDLLRRPFLRFTRAPDRTAAAGEASTLVEALTALDL